MTDAIITVEHLGKRYRIKHQQEGRSYVALRDVIAAKLMAPMNWLGAQAGSRNSSDPGTPRPSRDAREDFWALKDVSFAVNRGEVVGIVGRNGAGKSTLLKVLSRITEPTEGRVTLKGRVASLLEVGTGFHPELTGRENIFLNGAILGMHRAEIKRKFDEIVAFAEVEQFLDTPVKRYSSGMYVRLAFAVAAHLEPEILVVDEVLAVGDAEFQKKCIGKMGDVSRGGRTVLFVSHNMGAIRALCTRALVIAAGRAQFDGAVDLAITNYLSDLDLGPSARPEWTWAEHEAPGNGEIAVRAVRLVGEKSPGPVFRPDEFISVTIEYQQARSVPGMRFGFWLLTRTGEIAFVTTDQSVRKETDKSPGYYQTTCKIPADLLNRTTYVVRISASVPGSSMLVQQMDVGQFSVEGPGNDGSKGAESWPGVLCPKIEWRVARLEPAQDVAG